MKILLPEPEEEEHEHTHEHKFVQGLLYFTHSHRHPAHQLDPLAAKPHPHSNGWHSHPHPREHWRYEEGE